MSLATGARAGVYEIVSKIGAGGMGAGHRGRDPGLDRDVAIQTLPAGLAADGHYLDDDRFELEFAPRRA